MALCLQFQRGILFPQPAGAPKKRAVSRRRTAPAGAGGLHSAPGYAAVPKAIDCIPVPPLNSLFGAKKKDTIIVL